MTTQDKKINRRSFLKIMGWGAFFITMILSVGGFIRFLFPRTLFEKPPVFKIGFPDNLNFIGESDLQISEQWKIEQSVWLVKDNKRIYAMHAKCTHLGCTPNFFPEDVAIKCPCHGSQFHLNGLNYAGPAPRPLDRFRIAVNDEGEIFVDKSKVYKHKEFDKKGAYLEV